MNSLAFVASFLILQTGFSELGYLLIHHHLLPLFSFQRWILVQIRLKCMYFVAFDPTKALSSKIELRRAYSCEIMLTTIKMPLPDMMAAVLALDSSTLDNDQVENLIKFCPTKEDMEMLKYYTGNKATLVKCEQFSMELMKVPHIESKLRVFTFKIAFQVRICCWI